MRKRTWGATLGVVLAVSAAFSSLAYACDHAAAAGGPESTATVPSLTVDVALPLDHVRVRHVSLVCTQATICDGSRPSAAEAVRRSARVARTLGRALVITVGAVLDSLAGAAVHATADLV